MSVYVRADVKADEFGLPGNRHHCGIANAIMLADPDIVHVRVDEERIRFSRRSTGTRFEFVTPPRAAQFVREFDQRVAAEKSGGKKTVAKPFTLVLSDMHLIRESPRQQRDPVRAIQDVAKKASGTRASQRAAAPSTATKAAKVVVNAGPRPKKASSPRRRPSQRMEVGSS